MPTFTPAGNEFVVHGTDSGAFGAPFAIQDTPEITALPGVGGFAVAWLDSRGDPDFPQATARRFDRSGNPLGGELGTNGGSVGQREHVGDIAGP